MSDVAVVDAVPEVDPRRDPEDPGRVVAGRGGCRLYIDHPARHTPPPRYERRPQFPLDYERRDRNQKRRTQICADMAAAAGELPAHLHRALMAWLGFANDQCEDVWPSLATVARRVHGPDHYGPERGAGARTAAAWAKDLERLGWLVWMHPPIKRRSDGAVIGQSNRYRIDIPEKWRQAQLEREDARKAASRAERRRNNNGGRTTTPRGRSDASEPNPSRIYAAAERQRREQQAASAAAEQTQPPMSDEDRRRALADARRSIEQAKARGSAARERPPP